MNKTEAIAQLNSRIIKVLKTYDPVTLNGGDKEYSFLCLVNDGGFKEESYSIRVVDEGKETEQAGFVGGKIPPIAMGKRLDELKQLGTLTILDIDKLNIPYAKIKIDGATKFVAEIDGEVRIEDGE